MGVYIPHFDQISVKNVSFGNPIPLSLHRWGEIWQGGGDLQSPPPLLRAKFHPHRCNVSPLRGDKPQNRPLSNLNTGAMLPVIIQTPENKTFPTKVIYVA